LIIDPSILNSRQRPGQTVDATSKTQLTLVQVAQLNSGIDVSYGGQRIDLQTTMFSPDGQRVVTIFEGGVGMGGGALLWDWPRLQTIEGFPARSATAVAFSRDGKLMLCGGDDGVLRIWNFESGKTMRVLHRYTSMTPIFSGRIHIVAFSPDGRLAYSATTGDGRNPPPETGVRVWDTGTFTQVRSLNAHAAGVLGLAVSADGQKVLTCGDTTIVVWDAKTGEEIGRILDHSAQVRGVAFLPDSRRAVSWSDDWTIRLWDVESGKEIRRFTNHRYLIPGWAAVSPNGRLLASSGGGELSFWDVETGRPLQVLHPEIMRGAQGGLGSGAFSPDGQHLVWRFAAGWARVYRLDETAKNASSDGPAADEVRTSTEAQAIQKTPNPRPRQPNILAGGSAPVLVSKLRHGPGDDWNSQPDDVRNLVGIVSRDWNRPLTCQVVDPAVDSVRLRQAPIAFLSGSKAPEFSPRAKVNLRDFVRAGGCLMASNYGGEFDAGFKVLMKELFPEDKSELRRLADDHPVLRIKHVLPTRIGIFRIVWGIDRGDRTVVIYSPDSQSYLWARSERSPADSSVRDAIMVGQNVIEYFTGGKADFDKLSAE
jgi:hypothetical protein